MSYPQRRFRVALVMTRFEIRAVGQNIDGNQPILFYRVTPVGGATGATRFLRVPETICIPPMLRPWRMVDTLCLSRA